MTTSSALRRLGTVLAAAALLATACTADDPTGAGDRPEAVRLDGAQLASALTPFDDCGQLLDHIHERAAESATPHGIATSVRPLAMEESLSRTMAAGEGDDAAGPAPVADGSTASQAGQDFSTTNVQEVGVDEPDTVKTDGERLFAVAQSAVHEVDVTGSEPTVAATLDVPDDGGHLLLLDGDRLLVVTSRWGVIGIPEPLPTPGGPASDGPASGVAIAPAPSEPTTTFTLFDVATPGAPAVVATMDVDGTHLSSRMVDGTVRAVVQLGTAPIAWSYPATDSSTAEAEALEANRAAVEETTVDDWLPQYRRVDLRADTPVETEGTLPECSDVRRPVEFSGLGSMSVLTLDLDEGLSSDETVTVMAAGEHVYASSTALYLATNRWYDPEVADPSRYDEAPDLTTEIHKLDISADGPARYVGSGQVRGHLLNQFSMSEHEGDLRVATTDGFQWWGDQGPPTESFVTVLEDAGDHLSPAGQVGGLGKGERIYSVRFLGEMGYVVTFRQTDPLYTVDLSDPAAPVVRGELKILGYSAYLHPVGDGLLIGVGQDATEEGRTLGTQVSLFDVSDPDDPRRLHAARLGQGSSVAEFDHHAFLHWAATGLTVLPVELYDEVAGDGAPGVSRGGTVPADGGDDVVEVAPDQLDDEGGGDDPVRPVEPAEPPTDPDGPVEDTPLTIEPRRFPDGWFSGAVGLSIDRGGIEEVGRVTHMEAAGTGDHWPAITRSVVVGNTLYTLSEAGVMASDLSTLAPRAFTSF